MLRIDVMQEMARLEFAAANWFAKMGSKERNAYIKSHPRSKYARNTGGVLSQQAGALANKSAARAKQHDARGSSLSAKGRQKASEHHAKMYKVRNEAANHYSDAAAHFRKGNHKAGMASLQKGHTVADRADKAHAAYKEKVAAQRASKRAVAPRTKREKLSRRASKSGEATGVRKKSSSLVGRNSKDVHAALRKKGFGSRKTRVGSDAVYNYYTHADGRKATVTLHGKSDENGLKQYTAKRVSIT